MTSSNETGRAYLKTLAHEQLIVLAPFLAQRWLDETLERLPSYDPHSVRSSFDVYINNSLEMNKAAERVAALGPVVAPFILERLHEDLQLGSAPFILLRIIALIGDEKMLPGLIAIADAFSPAPPLIRLECISVIGQLNRGAADEFLCNVVRNWDAPYRSAALGQLDPQKYPAWLELVRGLLNDPDREVQKAILRALNEDQTLALKAELIALLYSKHYGAAFYASQKLCKIAPKVADDLFHVDDKRKGPYFKTFAINILGRSKQEKHWPRLCRMLLEDGNKMVRAEAVKAVGSLKKFKDESVRLEVIAALRAALQNETAREVIDAIPSVIIKAAYVELGEAALAAHARMSRYWEEATLERLRELAAKA